MSDAPPVLLIGGPPGAGKTAVAEAVAHGAQQGVHLSADTFLGFVRHPLPAWGDEALDQGRAVLRALALSAATFATAGYSVVVDSIFVPDRVPLFVADLRAGGVTDVDLAVLRVPLETALARTRARGSVPPDEQVRAFHERFVDLGELGAHAVEAGSPDLGPDAVAAEISRRARAGALRLAP